MGRSDSRTSDGTGDDSRRDKFLDPYFQNAKPDQVVAILKAREPARILVAIGDKNNDSPHLEFKQRWVNQFNFYLNDKHWGRLFVRMCPHFPFSARVCLNQHHWLAIRMQEEGIDFQQCTNAFLKCGNPARLQEFADSLTPQDLLKCGQKWLAAFTPFFSDRERKQLVVSTVCSSPKWSIATTSSSIAAPRWMNSPNGCWI